MKYKINEIFYSLQGEGHHAGQAAIFVRFAGCNLKCSFCDTNHDLYKEMTQTEILSEIDRFPLAPVVLTGGEPALQVRAELTQAIHNHGNAVHIETNGTRKLYGVYNWITVSPKTDKIICDAHEIKVLWGTKTGTKRMLKSWAKNYGDKAWLSIQPCSEQNIDEIINYIKENPQWKLSLQLQKILKIR